MRHKKKILLAMVLISTGLGLSLYKSHRPRYPISANESAAIAFIKKLSTLQNRFQASGLVDLDRNRAGEYAFLGELLGQRPIRGSTRYFNPGKGPDPNISYVGDGIYRRCGYYFRMFLPSSTRGRMDVTEPDEGKPSPAVHVPSAEVLWRCMAWPERYGVTGNRAFVTDQSGDYLYTHGEACRYSGLERMPAVDAFNPKGDGPYVEYTLAPNGVSRDGSRWAVG